MTGDGGRPRLRRRVRERLRALLPDAAYAAMMRRWRDLEHDLARLPAARARRRAGDRPVQVGFWPHRPDQYHVVSRICAHLGHGITTSRRRADVLVAWDTATRWTPPADLVRPEVVNARCTDISKQRVNEVFEAVTGRALAVDPRTHHGMAVEKSDQNAVHDGEQVSCPREPRQGSVYQRLVDNTVDGGTHVVDIRVPVVGGTIPLVYLRRRPLDRRFRSGNERADSLPVDEVLTTDEVDELLAVAAAMGLDLGEMDVLRDRADGSLWVVDVNTTPWGPPSGIGDEDGSRAVAVLAAAFEQHVLAPRLPAG